MRRRYLRLTTKEAEKKSWRPGYYADGDGLYLQVSASKTKSWIFRYTRNGISHEMGLGSQRYITLAEARAKTVDARRLLIDGVDPLVVRRQRAQAQALEAAKSETFSQCAAAYIRSHKPSWKNHKHGEQWTNTIATYCEPIIGKLSVQRIDTALVMKVLEPIWAEKPETASRLRGRIESILDWARVRGYRTGENPARWRGHLDKLLPALRSHNTKHHAALPFAQIADFLASVRTQPGTAAQALEVAILTAARTGEVIGARWSEVDLDDCLWTIPAERMKAQRDHRVPLSACAVAVLRGLYEQRQAADDYVFPARNPRNPLSNMAMLQLLKRMGRKDLTVHGFRSTFRDWASERTSYPREVCEMALAHAVGDQVEAAYRRGDLFEKRRGLMNDWAKFCESSKNR